MDDWVISIQNYSIKINSNLYVKKHKKCFKILKRETKEIIVENWQFNLKTAGFRCKLLNFEYSLWELCKSSNFAWLKKGIKIRDHELNRLKKTAWTKIIKQQLIVGKIGKLI